MFAIEKSIHQKLTRTTRLIVWVLAAVLFISMFILPRGTLVLAFNKTYNAPNVLFWRAVNMLGDGIIFAYIGMYLLLTKFRRFIYFSFLVGIQTLIVQGFKRSLANGAARPMKYFNENIHYLLNVGENVNIHMSDTFPSGHATTAFTVAFFMMFMLKKTHQQLIVFAIFSVAAMARVYLAQHFFFDVCAGLLCSILTVQIVDLMYERFKIYKVKGSLLTMFSKELRTKELEPTYEVF